VDLKPAKLRRKCPENPNKSAKSGNQKEKFFLTFFFVADFAMPRAATLYRLALMDCRAVATPCRFRQRRYTPYYSLTDHSWFFL
jgi:hypothetical protein